MVNRWPTAPQDHRGAHDISGRAPKVIESFNTAIAMRRIGRPEEIVRVVAFLAAAERAHLAATTSG